MKILKERSRIYNKKNYYKFKINIPEEILKKSGLKDGDNLEPIVEKKGEIKLRKK